MIFLLARIFTSEPIGIVHFAKEEDDLWFNYHQCEVLNAWVTNAEENYMGLSEFESDLNALKYLLKLDESEASLSFGEVLDMLHCRLVSSLKKISGNYTTFAQVVLGD